MRTAIIWMVAALGCMGLAAGTNVMKTRSCNEGYHECIYNGICIPNYMVCDGSPDCPNFDDDEHGCDSATEWPCYGGQYQCQAGECIPREWLCDGNADCPFYGDDEQGCTTESTTTTTTAPPQCDPENSFDYIYDRCVLVEPFTSTNWDEARYLCELFNSDLVVLDDYNFYAELLQYITDKGLDSHSYWVGATDRAVEGVWFWVDSTLVHSGAPLWALYGCTGDYQLEPRPSEAESQDCGFLDMDRGLHMSDASCDESYATICQARSG